MNLEILYQVVEFWLALQIASLGGAAKISLPGVLSV